MRPGMLVDGRGHTWTVEIPESRRERAKGLLGRTGIGHHRGLLIERTRSVHTFGMRFAITAVILGRDLVVVAVLRMRPGRVAQPRLQGRHVLECAADADMMVGDRLAWLDHPGNTSPISGR